MRMRGFMAGGAEVSRPGGHSPEIHDGGSRPPLQPPSPVAAASRRRRALRDTCQEPYVSLATASIIGAEGRTNVNVVPAPGADSTWIRPPWSDTMPCTMARPRPVPPFFVV